MNCWNYIEGDPVNYSDPSGLLVEPGDIQDFSKAILKMINHPEEAYRMGVAGREEVRKHSIEQTIYDYEKMTAGILSG